MKTFYRNVLQYFLIIVLSSSIFSQPRPCDGAAPCNATWTIATLYGVNITTCNGGTGCAVDIMYAYRTCASPTPFFQELEILSITACDQCTNCNRDQLQLAVLQYLLDNNPMQFNVWIGASTVRLITAQCLKSTLVQDPMGGGSHIMHEVCDIGGCCSVILKVHPATDQNGNPYIQIDGVIADAIHSIDPNPLICPKINTPEIPVDGHCYFDCNWILQTEISFLTKSAFDVDFDLRKYPSKHAHTHSGVLKVYDMQGSLVYETPVVNLEWTDINSFVALHSSLQSSVYVYHFDSQAESFQGILSIVR